MSEGNGEDVEGSRPDQPEMTGDRHAFEHTGNPVVDGVLESLQRLDDASVSEHVAVFESAHEQLRSALADAGNDTGS